MSAMDMESATTSAIVTVRTASEEAVARSVSSSLRMKSLLDTRIRWQCELKSGEPLTWIQRPLLHSLPSHRLRSRLRCLLHLLQAKEQQMSAKDVSLSVLKKVFSVWAYIREKFGLRGVNVPIRKAPPPPGQRQSKRFSFNNLWGDRHVVSCM